MKPETSNRIILRDVIEEDICVFFDQQLDPDANHMAAFTSGDRNDREAFFAHWEKLIADGSVIKRTVTLNDEVAGYVASFQRAGEREVCYWYGKEFWGKGVATNALSDFLNVVPSRPLFARVAKDNISSMRVLEKSGFQIVRYETAFAGARGEEIEEAVFVVLS